MPPHETPNQITRPSITNRRLARVQLMKSWLLRLSACALLIVSSFVVAKPDFHHFLHWHPDWVEQALDWKIDHPLQPIPAEQFARPAPEMEGMTSHLKNRTYRVTLPLIAHFSGLGIRGAEIIAFVSALLFPIVLYAFFHRSLEDPITAFLLALTVSCSYVGQWGIHNFGFFDGVGYLLLALAIYTRHPALIATTLIFGAFSDERVLTATPLVYLLHGGLEKPTKGQWGVIAGCVVFVILRIAFGLHTGVSYGGGHVGWASFRYNLAFLPLAVALVYKGLLVTSVAGLLGMSQKQILTLAIAAAPGIFASLAVWDLCRSLAYTFPAMLLLSISAKDQPTFAKLALFGAIVSVAIPTYNFWGGVVTHF